MKITQMRTNRVFIQSIYKEHRVGISHHLLHLEETPLSPCISNLYGQYIMRNARLDEAQAGIKIAGKSINNLRYANETTIMAENEEELKILLMKVKRRVKKLA